MEFTVKSDDFRKALLQASIHGSKAAGMYNKLRLEFFDNYCIFVCTDGYAIVRTRINIYNSNIPEGTVFILNDFNNLLRTSIYLYFPLVTIEIFQESKKVSIRSGEKRFSISLDTDLNFAKFQSFNEYSIDSTKTSYDISIMERRFKNIKYAADKHNNAFNKIFFNENRMYATDSKRIALNTSTSFTAPFDFSVSISVMELICNTLRGIFDLYKGNRFLVFKDDYANEVIVPVEGAPCFDYKKVLNLEYKHVVKTNAKLFSSSLEFIQSYMENKKIDNKFIGVSWRDDTLRFLSEQNEVETKIPVSNKFGFTISFALPNLLGCLRQFKNSDIEIQLNSSLAPIKLHRVENIEDECIVMPLNTKVDPFEVE